MNTSPQTTVSVWIVRHTILVWFGIFPERAVHHPAFVFSTLDAGPVWHPAGAIGLGARVGRIVDDHFRLLCPGGRRFWPLPCQRLYRCFPVAHLWRHVLFLCGGLVRATTRVSLYFVCRRLDRFDHALLPDPHQDA